MTAFQIILLLSLTFLIVFVIKSKSILIERVLSISLLMGALFLSIFPTFATAIANFVGIGRGTDLILYIFILFVFYRLSIISDRFHRIDRKLTEIVREIAISAPLFGESDTPKK